MQGSGRSEDGADGQYDDSLPWVEQSAPGAYEEEPLVSRPVLIAGLLGFLVVLAAVVGGIYWMISRDADSADNISLADSVGLEVIRAPTTPFKVRPDEPGGAAVPDQDKSVLAEAGGQEPDLSGNVAPSNEEPLPPPLPQESPAPAPVAPAPVKPAPVVVPAPKPPVVAPKPAPKPQVATPKPPVATPKPPVAAPKPEPKPEPAPKPSATGGYALQLGAFSSRDRAMAAWSDYSSRYGALGGLAADVQSVNSGGKTLFRLRATGLSSQGAANAKCAELQSSGLGCIVARR